VYGSGDVHVVVPTDVKLKKGISPKILSFKAKISITHVALNVSSIGRKLKIATINL